MTAIGRDWREWHHTVHHTVRCHGQIHVHIAHHCMRCVPISFYGQTIRIEWPANTLGNISNVSAVCFYRRIGRSPLVTLRALCVAHVGLVGSYFCIYYLVIVSCFLAKRIFALCRRNSTSQFHCCPCPPHVPVSPSNDSTSSNVTTTMAQCDI